MKPGALYRSDYMKVWRVGTLFRARYYKRVCDVWQRISIEEYLTAWTDSDGVENLLTETVKGQTRQYTTYIFEYKP